MSGRILLVLLLTGTLGCLASARESVKPATETPCKSILEGTVEIHCGDSAYKIDVQIGKAKIVNSAGKNYRNGEADVTFSGPDVQTVLKKTLDYSGDDWGVTINLPGQNNDDFSQLVFMFEPGQGRIRRVSLIRDNISNGKRIIELTCSGS